MEKKSLWDPKLLAPYALDQEFVTHPVTKAYFDLFMRVVAAATTEKPAAEFGQIMMMMEEPLFEMLQDQAPATLNTGNSLRATASGNRVSASLNLTNGTKYARLIRVRAEWDEEPSGNPYLIVYKDNYLDLMPEENRSLAMDIFLPPGHGRQVHGRLIVEGSNTSTREIAITIDRK